MVKVDRNQTPPASLAIESNKGSKNYRSRDVIQQLNHDFSGKCYLCEINNLQSIEVEHLKPHHNGNDRVRMFDWNNLFLSCAHCNSIKNAKKYEKNVLDCCNVDPETKIQQELVSGHVKVSPLDDSAEAETTADLIYDCFEQTNTGIREFECAVRVKALQKTMIALYQSLSNYKEDKSTTNLLILRGMLDRTYKFAGFTRTYVRLHIKEYPELESYINLS